MPACKTCADNGDLGKTCPHCDDCDQRATWRMPSRSEQWCEQHAARRGYRMYFDTKSILTDLIRDLRSEFVTYDETDGGISFCHVDDGGMKIAVDRAEARLRQITEGMYEHR